MLMFDSTGRPVATSMEEFPGPDRIALEHESRKPIKDLVLEWIESEEEEIVADFFAAAHRNQDAIRDALRHIMAIADSSTNVAMTLDQVRWLSGLYDSVDPGATSTEMARRHGVSKQDWLQGCNRLCRLFGLPRMTPQRSESAKRNMSARNQRPPRATITSS